MGAGAIPRPCFSAASWEVQQTLLCVILQEIPSPCIYQRLRGSFYLGLHQVQNPPEQAGSAQFNCGGDFQSVGLERLLRTRWRKALPAHLQPKASHQTSTRAKSCSTCSLRIIPCPRKTREPLHHPGGAMARECSPAWTSRTGAPCTSQNTWCPPHPKLLYLGVLLETFAPFLSLETLSEPRHKHLTSSETLGLRESFVSVCYLISMSKKEEQVIISCFHGGVQ